MLICYVTFFQETLTSSRTSEPYLTKDTQRHPKIEKLENFSTRNMKTFLQSRAEVVDPITTSRRFTPYALRDQGKERKRERERERNRTVVFFHKEGWYTGGKAGVGNHLQVGNFSYESPRTLCATGKRTRRIRVTIQVFPLLTHSADFFSVVSVFLRWSSRKNV